MSRFLLFVSAVLFASTASAATLSWPGSAPCDTTLQDCINAAAVNDTVLINSGAGEITTPVFIGKPLIVKSASTARARFRNTTITIQSTFAGPGNVNVLENLQLIATPLSLRLGSNDPADEHTIELNHLDISGDTGVTPGIGLETPQFPSAKTVRIRNLRYSGGFAIAHTAAVPSLNLEIQDSQFISVQDGTLISVVFRGNSQAKVLRSRLDNLRNSLTTCLSFQAITGAALITDVDRNVFMGCDSAMSLTAQTGAVSIMARVRNNTFRSRRSGVDANGPALSLQLDNNIFSGIRSAALNLFGAPTVTLANNLYHQTPQPPLWEANPVVADPQFVSPFDLHLRPSSPAINAALATSIPAGGDFDGVTSSLPTIGAFNYQFGGSESHLATAENSTANITVLSDSISRPLSEVLVQSVVDGFPLPAWAPNHLGVYTTTAAPLRTVIFSQNQQSISPPRKFFVMDSNRHQTLSHVTDASNISNHITYLNWAPINGNPFAKPQVVQRAIPLGGVINNHPIGIWYDVFNARWAIFNQDQAPMPQGAMFDVTLPNDLVPYAFTAEAANSSSLDLIMDHPLLNNSPCAAVFVTPVFKGTYLPSSVLVRYRPTTNDGGRWTVVRGDGDLLQNDMDMNVYVDPVRSRACLSDGVFVDGLE
ncbi:MAG: hypothetical protein IPK97_02045 [Ahniella sp.]|nr:hypothetical protein [Ahniella sp.]